MDFSSVFFSLFINIDIVFEVCFSCWKYKELNDFLSLITFLDDAYLFKVVLFSKEVFIGSC